MFFKKQRENAPRQWADSVLKPGGKQRESDPASPDGAFYLCFSEGTYTFQTWSYHTDKNTADFTALFCDTAVDAICMLCRHYPTATVVRASSGDPHSFPRFYDLFLDANDWSEGRKVLSEPYSSHQELILLKTGADRGLLRAVYMNDNALMKETYQCCALPQGTRIPEGGYQDVKAILRDGNFPVDVSPVGFGDNAVDFAVDLSQIPHERVIGVFRDACDRRGKRLEILSALK